MGIIISLIAVLPLLLIFVAIIAVLELNNQYGSLTSYLTKDWRYHYDLKNRKLIKTIDKIREKKGINYFIVLLIIFVVFILTK
ncbi:hypothetical protein PRVXT_000687 [Proteinivorax tanatarense]|uniref:Uncharacterized protein n=1 Tax=Proteinivorax tanatarense TaxID=1260629 RepID=A0AAU7VNA6_9FIRM